MTASVQYMTPEHILALLDELAATTACLGVTQERLAESEEMLSAIRNGEIDGLVVAGPRGDQVFTLKGTDHAYRVMIEAMEEGAATLGDDGTILFCNRRFAAMLRLPHAQVLGASMTQFLTLEDQMHFADLVLACRLNGARNEAILQAGDGTRVPVSLACSVLPNGESESLCLVATDLTARYAAETEIRDLNLTLEARVEARTAELQQANMALRESELHFRLALRNAPVSVAIQDRDLRYIWAYSQRTMYPEAIIGKFDTDIFTLEEAAHLQRLKRRVLDENIVLQEAMWLDRPGGRIFLDIYWEPIHDAQGQVIGVGSTTVNLTPLKLAEEAAAAANKEIQSIIDNTPAIVYAFDLDERFMLANSTMAALFNTTPERMIGKRRHEFMPKEDADWHEANDRQAIEEGKALEFEEYNQLTDRSITWLTAKFPLRDAEGRIYAVAGISTDITARQQAEETLREADRAKDEFLAVISHELHTPLTAILGWSEEALRAGTPDSLAQAMPIVHRNAVRQKRLVDDLLDISRLLHQEIRLRWEQFDLAAQAAQAVENIQQQAVTKGVQIVYTPPPAPLLITADAARLQQCLGNLLTNSFKFTPAGGTIIVRCWRDGDDAAVSVEDTGRGMPPEALETVFDLFRQVNRDERAGGLGLGLAITHQLIALHGGSIRAESAGLGCGSRFTITLPDANAVSGGWDSEDSEVTCS